MCVQHLLTMGAITMGLQHGLLKIGTVFKKIMHISYTSLDTPVMALGLLCTHSCNEGDGDGICTTAGSAQGGFRIRVHYVLSKCEV